MSHDAAPGLLAIAFDTMNKIVGTLCAVAASCCIAFVVVHGNESARPVSLPTGKTLNASVPGFLGRTNSFPATIALSHDGGYVAFLNQGYGTEQANIRQSIAILDLTSNELRDFPDDRLRGDEKTTRLSYFIGLAFSLDDQHLYASMGSAEENGIAVYKFADGKVVPERFITILAQHIAPGKTVTLDSGREPAGTVPAYPAGFTVLGSSKGDRLLVANNLSDNVVLLDAEYTGFGKPENCVPWPR